MLKLKSKYGKVHILTYILVIWTIYPQLIHTIIHFLINMFNDFLITWYVHNFFETVMKTAESGERNQNFQCTEPLNSLLRANVRFER